MAGVSVVIPVFRSEGSIALLVERLSRILPDLCHAWEVILVEDNGGDGSWRVVQELARRFAQVRGFQLTRNFGQHSALLCGIRAAKYEIIVTMDDDLQHPPERIADLLAKLNEGFDVVYGAPAKQRHGLLRNMASMMTKWVLQGAMGAKTARRMSAFRAFRASLRVAFADFRGPTVNIDVLLTWGTTNFTAITIPHANRSIGDSTYTLGKLITHAFNMLTGFSTLPLRFASIVGLLMTCFGFLLFAFIIISQLVVYQFEVPGFTFIASLITIFAGAQLFSLGVIGEYIARMHLRSMDKPAYIVAQSTKSAEALVK